MSRSILQPRRPPNITTTEWHEPESPKAFFRLLRQNHAYYHRVFEKWLRQAGFEVRWIRKRVYHEVWNLHLLRGGVNPGDEAEATREVICDTVKRCGVKCSKRDVEVSVIGNRVGVAFIFNLGTPGSLSFSMGRESWCADAWP